MKPTRSILASLLAVSASVTTGSHVGWAQAPAKPLTAAPAVPVAPGAVPPGKPLAAMSLADVQQHPELTKMPKGFVDFTIEEGDLAELITTISTITGKRFIYGGKVRNIKVNIYAPKNQRITPAEAYQTFLSVLETNGLTVIPHGKFLKIVESAGVASQTTPLYSTGQPVPPEDRYVTRLYRLAHVSAEEVTALLAKFKSKDADISLYAPGNLLILTDTASNIRRMLELVEELDVGGAGDQLWVEPVHYTTATEMAQRVNEIFDVKAAAAAAPGKATGIAAGGDMRITKIIPEDRTNTLIIVATERAYLRVLELVRRLDVPNTGEGEVHVLPLQHAMAEELAATLNAILAGAPGAAKTPGGPPAAPGQAGIFEGAVKLTADKASNAIVITSSLRDYGSLRLVIDKLDMPRRQVFIEAVIMDLSVDHSNKLGLSYHGGANEPIIGNDPSLVYGGLNPMNSIGLPNPTELQGLALGVRGPGLAGSTQLLGTGISIPAFGVVLNALATSGDANVLATPHIIATDNVAAEINVGENIPLQTNAGGIPNLGGAAGAATGALGALGGLGGFGMGGFAAPRADVGTKIKVVPHINDSDEVRLELTEEISERGASSGTLGAVSITKRNAQTTVVVHDQQTVVIGGLMRDAVTTSERKIPILGDIPVLGFLFRNTEKGKRKTNLLLVLTPYVIREQNDLRTVFERKMQERQEFLDRYFVFSDQKHYEPPVDYSRSNGLVENIRQSYIGIADRKRLEEETRPRELRVHDAQQPIEMPLVPTPGVGLGRPGAAPPGAAPPGAAPPGAAPPGTAPPGAAPAAAPAPNAPAAPAGAAPVAPPVGIILAPSGGTPPTQPAAPSPPPGVIPPPPGAAPAPPPPGAGPAPAPPGAGPAPLPPGAPPPTAPQRTEWGGTGAPPPSMIVPPLGSLTFVRAPAATRPTAPRWTSN